MDPASAALCEGLGPMEPSTYAALLKSKSLPNLPHELLLSISDLLVRFRYINALAQTNKRLYWHLNNYLYSLDVHVTGGSALIWAAQRGLRRTAWLSLAEGADIEASNVVTIPRQLGCLSFDSMSTCLTPLQTALCYGSDSVARFLINHGAISSSSYPPELCSCTNLHMAAAMGLTSALKILIDQGMDVGARDGRLQTPLHYTATVQHRNSLDQARVVMLLLLNNADPITEDSQGTRPVSIGKKRSNPVVKMLSEKGAAVKAYEISLQDRELFGMWRMSKERREEAAWLEEKKEKQLAIERAKRERDQDNKKKRVAAEQRRAIAKSREREEMTRRKGAQKVIQTYAKERADQTAAAQKVVKEEARIEKARSERQGAVKEAWSRMRKEADQRGRVTTKPDLLTKADCNHPSGLWKCRVRKTCQSCEISAKWLSLCTDCGFVICMRCNLGKA
ncbi:ankyrin [Mytilinidion resinicola]|uniref:Ankyrin n=1 Tax=Mytilinidion resinicola TaxID=574789 RepID=A0A6A6Y4G8_9PEZI|nr:ankyrin [Mytilinidion resinicola]KAF2803741.1 ankyrin [Mytilinidion resinicola]